MAARVGVPSLQAGLARALCLWRVAWGHAAIYLPIILMGLLALGTYWLVRYAPVFGLPEPQRPARHVPDSFMRQFSVKTFDGGGRLKSELRGKEWRYYPDTDTVEVDEPRVHSFNEAGRLTVATGRRGLSNGDGTEVQLFGDAVVVREAVTTPSGQVLPRVEMRSEFLHLYTDVERVKTHRPVVLIRDGDRFTADAMDYDNLDRVARLTGRVRGLFSPRPAGGR